MVDNQIMSYNPIYFNYSLASTKTSTVGEHRATVICSSVADGFTLFNFQITHRGEQPPNDTTKTIFSILFLIIFAWLIFTTFNTLTHFLKLDLDVKDLSYSLIGYFILIGFYILSLDYYGNKLALSMLLIFIKTGALTHALIPLLAFTLSMTIGALRRKKLNDE